MLDNEKSGRAGGRCENIFKYNIFEKGLEKNKIIKYFLGSYTAVSGNYFQY